MNKRFIAVMVFALVAGLTCAAYAEVQNVRISGDITVLGIARDKLPLTEESSTYDSDFGKKMRTGLAQTRVKVEADLTDNVSTTVRLLNERVWGQTEAANNTDIDLDLAYVTMKEFLYSPLTLSIGRQPLRYGNALIIGDPDTNGIVAGHLATAAGVLLPNSLDDLSLRKSFDAIKAVLDYDPLVVDLFTAKISENAINASDDITLYGINAAYKVNNDLNTEFYVFERVRDAGLTIDTVALINPLQLTSKTEVLNTAGGRFAYTGIQDTLLGLEGAFQFGNHIANTALYPDEGGANDNRSRKVKAYAIQAVLNHTMTNRKYTPSLGGSYTYLSGDKYQSTNRTYAGWDGMFEDQAGGTLFNKILGYSNSQLLNVNGGLKPSDDVRISLNYYYLLLNQPYTNAAMTTAVTLSGVPGDPTYFMNRDNLEIGHEVDLGLTYDYTEDVQLGLNGGAFIPGHAFASQNNDIASQVIGSMKVTF